MTVPLRCCFQDDNGVFGDKGAIGPLPTQSLNDDLLSGSFSIEDSEPSSFSSITDSWRHEPINSSYTCLDSFGNLAVQHSAPNLKRMVDVIRKPSIANVVNLESGLQCNSGFMNPTFPVLDPDSWINSFNNDQEETENLKKQEVHMSNFQAMKNSASPISRLSDPPIFFSFYKDGDDEFPGRELKLIIRKELTKSDVRRVGRIVIPKMDAEANLPTLSESEAKILHMNDATVDVTWKFRYRFWPNNKSRMYIMETTGEFVKTHQLQRGDLFIIYQNTKSGDYIVEGKKVMQPRESCNFRDGSTVNRDWHTQLPGDGDGHCYI